MAGKVLIIEDSRAFGALVCAQIEADLKVPTTHVLSKSAAEALLAQQSDAYFAAVVDLNLPDAPRGGAVDVTIQYGIPTVVFTGEINPALHQAFIAKGVADYVYKKGRHNLVYVSKLISRIQKNPHITVLVITESPGEYANIEKLLKTQRYNVRHCSSMETAKNLIRSDDSISLVIIDYPTNNNNGPSIASTLRESHDKQALAIIGISSSQYPLASAEFIKSGANDFLPTPYLPEELYCRVNQAADTLEQWQQLSESIDQKNMLLGMAAHDIRSPVAIMQKACQRLQRFIGEDPKALELAQMIERNADSLLATLTDLLDLSSLENIQHEKKFENIDINELIKNCVDSHKLIAERKATSIELKLHRQQMQLPADANGIDRVLDNLLSNAIKYSPPNSVIHVNTEENRGFFQIHVADAGPGITPEDSVNLFKPFKKLSAKTTGGETSTGLGLSICDRIIRLHHGEIMHVNNLHMDSPHAGSTFSVLLPIPQTATSR